MADHGHGGGGHAEHGAAHGHAEHGHSEHGGGGEKKSSLEFKDLLGLPLLKKFFDNTITTTKQFWGLIKEMSGMALDYASDFLDGVGELFRKTSSWGMLEAAGGHGGGGGHGHH